eukprot:3067757-Pyramimonas_sp.AAC.1
MLHRSPNFKTDTSRAPQGSWPRPTHTRATSPPHSSAEARQAGTSWSCRRFSPGWPRDLAHQYHPPTSR